MDASDARRADRLRAGYDLDEGGLPFGSIPAAFIESRDEARMVYPGAREVFRTASGASGSIARLVADHRGPGWPPPPGHTYFEVDYRILVEHPWDRQPPSHP